MKEQYYLEIHKTSAVRRKPWNPIFKVYNNYYRACGSKRKMLRLERKMKRKGWSTLVYPAIYARSTQYRSSFFSSHKTLSGFYHCVYCGKWLSKDQVTVDHIIPVGAAKYGGRARIYLRGHGVNDPENLAASCDRCNQKKGDKIGLWPIRAMLGKHRIYFLIRRTIRLFLFLTLFLLAVRLLNPDLFDRFLESARILQENAANILNGF